MTCLRGFKSGFGIFLKMRSFSSLTSVQQQALFQKVKQLKADGLGYKRIIKKIKFEDNVAVAQSTLSHWFNRDIQMVGGENFFEPIPSPKLSYFIGVMFGDGFLGIDKKNQDYFLGLKANDADFVENFSSTLAKILRKKKPFYVCQGADGHYSTKARSKRLYFFTKSLKDDFEKAKPFIEAFPADFIRGLADSEGTACVYVAKEKLLLRIDIANSTNFSLLVYVQELLKKIFKIETKLLLAKKAGERDSVIDGRVITRTKNVYRLTVRTTSGSYEFFQKIGFTIHRKMGRLQDYFFLTFAYDNANALQHWNKMYRKEGKFWRKNESY